MFLQNYYNLMRDIYMRFSLKDNQSAFTTITLPNGESYNYLITFKSSTGNYIPRFLVNPLFINYGAVAHGYGENILSVPDINDITSTTVCHPNNMLLAFGSGTTPVTINDYNVEQPISNLEFINISNTYTEDSFTITITGHNLNTEEITVSEMCFFGCITMEGYTNEPSALYREVFDSPITVPADGYFKFSYTIQMTIG